MEYARETPDLVAKSRFLGDWRDDQQQYQALMDSGLTFAKAYVGHQLPSGTGQSLLGIYQFLPAAHRNPRCGDHLTDTACWWRLKWLKCSVT
jgi:hypothetical protein